jgi:pyruvate/2-oxoglutarate dehydrogenase complex dihydrolipoamide dehydrogenase (E3) component
VSCDIFSTSNEFYSHPLVRSFTSASQFAEFPFSGPISITHPDIHHKFVTEEPIPGVKTVFGVAKSCTEIVVKVQPLNSDGELVEVPFDFLVAATGFSMPTFLATPGVTLQERREELKAVYNACLSGGDVVVGGGGVIALEVAGNIAEKVKAKPGAGKVIIVNSGPSLLPGYAAKYQTEATKQLKQLGVVLKLGERVSSHTSTTLATATGSFEVTLTSGAKISGVSAFLPAFVSGANTSWLESLPNVLDPNSKQVVLDQHLRR